MRNAALVASLAASLLACTRDFAHPRVSRETLDAEVDDDAPAAFASLSRAYDRVLGVGARLRLANVERCGKHVASYVGWIAMSDRDFGGLEMRALAARFLDADKRPVVVSLSPDGPAARAGAKIGDHVLSIGGTRVWTLAQASRAEQRLEAIGGRIEIEREGAKLELEVSPLRACDHTIRPVEAPALAAWMGQSDQIYVALRLVDLASDDELAFSIAHAMAENLLGVDPRNSSPNPILSFDVIPEPDATALAIEFGERAGYSAEDVEPILERRAVEEPWTVVRGLDPHSNPFLHPKGNTWVGEIPRRIVALRMLRAQRRAGAAARAAALP